MAGILIPLIAFMVSVGLLLLRIFKGSLTTVTLLEYQRAVLYRRGLPIREVGAGRYRVWSGTEKLIIVDTRPIQVNFENQGVVLRESLTAVYGISGAARVKDTRKVIYSARNYNQVPGFVFICCARSILNSCTANELRGNQDAAVEKIISRIRPRLEEAGFELLTFRLSQLSVAAPRKKASEGSDSFSTPD